MEPTRPFRKLLQEFRPKLTSSWTKAEDAKREKMETGIHPCLGLLRSPFGDHWWKSVPLCLNLLSLFWLFFGALDDGVQRGFAESFSGSYYGLHRFTNLYFSLYLLVSKLRPPNASLPHQDTMSPGVNTDDCVTWGSLTGHPRWGKKRAT